SARLVLLLLEFLELLPVKALGEELLTEADHERAAERIEDGRSIADRDGPGVIMNARAAVEDIADLKADRSATQPRVVRHDRKILADVGEQCEIEGGDRREVQCVTRKGVDQSRASPVGAQSSTHAVVRPAGLRLNLVPRLAP